MTEPVDWNKPIELMDGKPRVAESCGNYIWINSPDGYGGFHCDRQGCIGGVQVVRNRKEPVKHVYYLYFNEAMTPWEPGSQAWDYHTGLGDDKFSVNPGAGGLA